MFHFRGWCWIMTWNWGGTKLWHKLLRHRTFHGLNMFSWGRRDAGKVKGPAVVHRLLKRICLEPWSSDMWFEKPRADQGLLCKVWPIHGHWSSRRMQWLKRLTCDWSYKQKIPDARAANLKDYETTLPEWFNTTHESDWTLQNAIFRNSNTFGTLLFRWYSHPRAIVQISLVWDRRISVKNGA